MEKEAVALEYCPTAEMVADIVTKGLYRNKFSEIRSVAGVKYTKCAKGTLVLYDCINEAFICGTANCNRLYFGAISHKYTLFNIVHCH